jgi:hypothetical protein
MSCDLTSFKTTNIQYDRDMMWRLGDYFPDLINSMKNLPQSSTLVVTNQDIDMLSIQLGRKDNPRQLDRQVVMGENGRLYFKSLASHDTTNPVPLGPVRIRSGLRRSLGCLKILRQPTP